MLPAKDASDATLEAIVETAYNLQQCDGSPSSLADIRSACNLSLPCTVVYDDGAEFFSLENFASNTDTDGAWVCFHDHTHGDHCFASYAPSNVCPCQDVNIGAATRDEVVWVSKDV